MSSQQPGRGSAESLARAVSDRSVWVEYSVEHNRPVNIFETYKVTTSLNMSSPFSRRFLLLGFLCLWLTPTEQVIKIVSDPSPPVLRADVVLSIEGIVQSNIRTIAWFQSRQVDQEKFIAGVVNLGSSPFKPKGNITIANDGADTLANGALKIPNFKMTYVNYYTVLVITEKNMETATTLLIGEYIQLIILHDRYIGSIAAD
ncbi:unnamed protein product [Ranitomeya imitator]|uniref:Dirigent protein n=1 Tax=Ranitomeya imitator TaxID=111125 RepID=A0ABN9L259_9NEOB|nr:unnamed protein product [Ranitomeya imitator]